ncbi:YgiQ family radical SAM protein [Motiliproteus sediminis]|uniref:YgiQ family radical SAM protein n=1 Tax=Motiliproteus sediminis TaxID=1468178 RepID=UPI001AEF5392|nr:YgiQ family radical SAM protein [Motiliproteus sediminis]
MSAARQISLKSRATTRPPAPFLPMSRAEMTALGWDQCDVVLVTGDAYVDHPSFGMAVIGRVLEAQGLRVGIIAQPNWRDKRDFQRLGRPRLFFGVTAGNMDSMINRYTAERRLRHDDAYSPDGEGGKRPDRAVVVYAQRCREAFSEVPVILGGIEASLRRIAHYDYWSDKVRRSVLPDSKAEMLLYGNAEQALITVARHLDTGGDIAELSHLRGTAVMRREVPAEFALIDSTEVDRPGRTAAPQNPYHETPCSDGEKEHESEGAQPVRLLDRRYPRDLTCIRLPDYATVSSDPVMYAHASRVMHLETNPHNARALVQRHGDRDLWVNPPPLPLDTPELDAVFDLPYARAPHPAYGAARIPAWEMIRFSVNIMRGCFGGCTFCSITEHEGRIIQNRSEASILKEVEAIRDRVEGFTGTISDLGGPTANMYRLACKDPNIEASCRRLSCVYPGICSNLGTDHRHLTRLYRKARSLPGIKRVLIASGLRYDLAVEDPEYLRELVTHHVGGYLKIAPEHTEEGPLSKMMKPGMGTYYRFKKMFERFSREAGKQQYLIPYFISAHPGTEDGDMLNLALWLKQNNLKLDQVQNFIPSPLCNATTMYHSGRNPLKKIGKDSETITVPKGARQRRLHKALLRYHDPENWPLIREALLKMGRRELIGRGPKALVPPGETPQSRAKAAAGPRRKAGRGKARAAGDATGFKPGSQRSSATSGRSANARRSLARPAAKGS